MTQAKLAIGDWVVDGSGLKGKVYRIQDKEVHAARPIAAIYSEHGYSESCYTSTLTRIEPPSDSGVLAAVMLGKSLSTAKCAGSGTDPEIFAFNAAGAVVPAWEWLPRENDAKRMPFGSGTGAAAYWDGAQAELNLADSIACHGYLVHGVRRGLLTMHERLAMHDPTARLEPRDVAVLTLEQRRSAPDDAIALGCAPSLNAYGVKRFPPIHISDARRHRLRYSGAHLHFSAHESYTRKPAWFPNATVIMMDKLLGTVLTALGRDLEDPRRRRAYGRPGEHRVPAEQDGLYRLEYRTPGSFVLWSPQLFNVAADLGRLAFKLGLVQEDAFGLPDVADIIMNCDADAAAALLRQHESLFKLVFDRLYVSKAASALWAACQSGAKAFGCTSRTIADAWRLNAAGDPGVHFANWRDAYEK